MYGVICADKGGKCPARRVPWRMNPMAPHGIETRAHMLEPWSDGSQMFAVRTVHLICCGYNEIV